MSRTTRTPYGFAHVRILTQFCAKSQLRNMVHLTVGEEGEHFASKLSEYAARVEAMPKTYEQDGLGENAIVHLHYFLGSCDWYITERDREDEQLQAFGYADLGYGAEAGYISIVELLENDAELDLYWKLKPVKEAIRHS